MTASTWEGVLPIKANLFGYLTKMFSDMRCFSATLSLRIFHKFSIGFKSGLFPGHGKTSTFYFLRYEVTTFASWQGTPSCINILHSWMSMCNFNLAFDKSKYFSPFIAVTGVKKKSLLPLLDMSPKSIWLRGCFMVSTSNFGSKRFPFCLRTWCFLTANCWILLVAEKHFEPVFRISMLMGFGKF